MRTFVYLLIRVTQEVYFISQSSDFILQISLDQIG